jgi:hypothetical protein
MVEVVCACHVRAEELFYFGFGFSLVIPHRWVLTMMDNMRE